MVARRDGQLEVLVAANLLASVAHFADNALRFHRYPEPHWISGRCSGACSRHAYIPVIAALGSNQCRIRLVSCLCKYARTA
jgi:hypothetical protein